MTTDYTDLAARLRAWMETDAGYRYQDSDALEAADALEMLQHELNFCRTERDELCARFTEIAPCDPGDIPKLIAARACAAHRAAVARIAELEAVLREFVDCDDLRTRAGKINPVEPGCEKEVLMDEYRRRFRVAYLRARAALQEKKP